MSVGSEKIEKETDLRTQICNTLPTRYRERRLAVVVACDSGNQQLSECSWSKMDVLGMRAANAGALDIIGKWGKTYDC